MIIWNILIVIIIIILALAAIVGIKKIKENKVLHDISKSSDVEDLIKIYDANSTKRKESAKKRLVELGTTTTDPDDFVWIAHKFYDRSLVKEAQSLNVNLAERFSPEELLLKIKSRTGIPDSVCEDAVEQINDEKTLAEAYEKMEYAVQFRAGILEKIKDRGIIYSLAVNYPDREDVVSLLDEEQLSRFGLDCCRNGHHDWEIIEDRDTTNYELDIRGYYEVRRCRRCGRTVARDHDDVYGTTEEVQNPGLFNV